MIASAFGLCSGAWLMAAVLTHIEGTPKLIEYSIGVTVASVAMVLLNP